MRGIATLTLRVRPDIAAAAKWLLSQSEGATVEWIDMDAKGTSIPGDLEKMLKKAKAEPSTLGPENLWPSGSLHKPEISDPLTQRILQNPQVITAVKIKVGKGSVGLYLLEWGRPDEKVEIDPASNDPADVAAIQTIHNLLRKNRVIPDQDPDIEGYLKRELRSTEALAQRCLEEHQKLMATAHDILDELGKMDSEITRRSEPIRARGKEMESRV